MNTIIIGNNTKNKKPILLSKILSILPKWAYVLEYFPKTLALATVTVDFLPLTVYTAL